MNDGDRSQYHQQAEILLGKRPWTPGDVDQAVMLHDLLETPDGGPDPVAKKLRARLTGELEKRPRIVLRDRYEDDSRYGGRETADNAVTLLREALTLAEARVPHPGQAPEGASRLYTIRDRLAGVLAIRDTRSDVDEAIALYLRNRDDAAAIGLASLPGPALSLMTASIRRWRHTREAADRARARSAYAEAFATGAATHLPTAFDIATQWGGA